MISYPYGVSDDDFEDTQSLSFTSESDREPDVHILFIGADAQLAETYRLKLNLDGYRTSVLTTEDEARKTAASLKPDLIYLDLTSAESWGLKVLGGIRKNAATRSTPALLLVKSAGQAQPAVGPHDFLVPVRLAFDQFQGGSRRRRAHP